MQSATTLIAELEGREEKDEKRNRVASLLRFLDSTDEVKVGKSGRKSFQPGRKSVESKSSTRSEA